MLLEFGVVSRLCSYASGEWKVYVGNRREARLFADRVGFWGRKQTKLRAILDGIPESSTAMSSDHVPFVADYLEGRTTKDIARQLDISVKTAENHRAHMMEKIGAHNTAEVVRYAVRKGLLA